MMICVIKTGPDRNRADSLPTLPASGGQEAPDKSSPRIAIQNSRPNHKPECHMKLLPATILGIASLICTLAPEPAQAQQHRATRLGNPSTRFAPPLTSPDGLRSLLTDAKLRPDVESILKQANWSGKVDDLCRAAATSPISEWRIPVGTRMPFMSARKNGYPVALMDVLWAGDAPVDAYAFEFTSNGRKYRCITPKPCSNFFVEELGPEQPRISIVKTLPAEVSLCEPFEMSITVRNTSTMPLTQVRVMDVLPDGLRTASGKAALELDAGSLNPREGMLFKTRMVPTAAGRYENLAVVGSAEGARAQASATTLVRAPVLSIDCAAPPQAQVKRPVNVCLTVKNTGAVADPKVTVQLPIPQGVTLVSTTGSGTASEGLVTWELDNLAPEKPREVCASFVATEPTHLAFVPRAKGTCAAVVETACATRVIGVAGILLEVIDLEDPVITGDQVTYEIRVMNQGSAALANIKLACVLPDLQEFVSASGVTQARVSGRTITMEPLPSIEARDTVSWRVVAKATAAGDARFKAELSSDQFAVPVQEFEATQQY